MYRKSQEIAISHKGNWGVSYPRTANTLSCNMWITLLDQAWCDEDTLHYSSNCVPLSCYGDYGVLVCLGCQNKIPSNWKAKQQKFNFSHHSGGWMSNIRVPAWLHSGEGSLPGLQLAAFSLCPHMAERERKQAIWCLIPSWGPQPYDLPRPYLQILSHWGSGLQHMSFLRIQTFSP